MSRCDTIIANRQARLPFGKLKYNKVIAYDYDGTEGERPLKIVENNKLAYKIKKQKQLNQNQVNSLTNLLGAVSTYGGAHAFCFEPKLGIVFYQGGQIVAHMSISIDCNYLDSSIPIPATKAKYIRINKYKYPAEGFSKTASSKLVSLLEQLHFRIQ